MHPPRSIQLPWAECERVWPLPFPRSGWPLAGVSAQVPQAAKVTQLPSLPPGAPSGAQAALAIFAAMAIGPSGPLKSGCAFTSLSFCPGDLRQSGGLRESQVLTLWPEVTRLEPGGQGQPGNVGP